MEENENYIVVKTCEQDGDQGLLVLPGCVFAIKRQEWEGFKQYLNEDSCVYTSEWDYKINLWELYSEAKVIEVDQKVLDFIFEHGDDTALEFLRKGTRIQRNKENLEMIFNKLAIFRDLIRYYPKLNWRDRCFDYRDMGIIPMLKEWEIPPGEAYVEECKIRNKEKLVKEIRYSSRELRIIYETEEIYYTINFNGLCFKITIPDDVCLWNPHIFVQMTSDEVVISRTIPPDYPVLPFSGLYPSLEQAIPIVALKHTQKWSNPNIYNKKKSSVYGFFNSLLNSLTDDNYQEELKEFFTDYTWLYSGEKPEGMAAKFKELYVPYEKKSEHCYFGCYYVLENQNDFRGFGELTGNDLIFFNEMCHCYKVVVKEDDEDQDTLVVFDNWGDLCLSLENSDSPDFGKCLNPEQLQIIHQQWLEKGHKCNDEKHDGFNLNILGLHFSRDRKLAEKE